MIIDHVDNLELQDAEQHHNELAALYRLAEGLKFLNDQVQDIEEMVRGRLNNNREYHMFGNSPKLEGVRKDLVACAFHWYSVTACSYVQLVGLLVYGDVGKVGKYLTHVLPEVSTWRNKVGAHFALTAPRKEDTPAALAYSIMPPLTFDDDAFYVGTLRLTMVSEGQPSASRQDMRWSLTHSHEQLSSRYWPTP